MRVQSQGKQIARLDYEQAIKPELSELLWKKFCEEVTDNLQTVILSDYAKGSLCNPQAYIEFARRKNIPILIDPKGRDYEKYKGAFCITPNRSEFISVMGEYSDKRALEKKMSALGKQLKLGCLLVTQGADGMSLWLTGDTFHHVKSQAKEIFDVSGAGDTVIATLVSQLKLESPYAFLGKHQQANIIQAVEAANFAAGLVVAKHGTATVTQHELNGSKLLTDESIDDWVNQCRKQGLSIAFTNGCFDILHKGHISYLREAARYANRLLVAVNSDASVKRLKHEPRPINTLADRIDVLSELRCIDSIVFFGDKESENDTPIELIKRIRPDFLIKGGDYDADRLTEGKVVKSYAGEVKIVGYQHGYSTSNQIKKILSTQEALCK